MLKRAFLFSCITFGSSLSTPAAVDQDPFDLIAIRSPKTLETTVVQPWTVSSSDPRIRQKVLEITVCEWWPGQKVRVPVTLCAPAEGPPCENLVISNMGLNPRPQMPSGVLLTLLTEHRVGIAFAGMGTIDQMEPKGLLQTGMKTQLLKTRDPRYTPAWIWGMTDMRALTAAIVEKEAFLPKKVLATGGSKRGVGAAVCGIHDDRFTAILPFVAPILSNPGGAYVQGSALQDEAALNAAFLDELPPGPNPLGLPPTSREALLQREQRRADQSIDIDTASAAGWTKTDIVAFNDHAWDVCRIADHIDAVTARGLLFFYHVGTNDNVSPGLAQLGVTHPSFPLFILPGGQHGGPKSSGFTLQTPTQPEAEDNLLAIAMHHFFDARPLVRSPTITYRREGDHLTVTATFEDSVRLTASSLSWCTDRHPPYTLASEYDDWNSIPMQRSGQQSWSATVAAPSGTPIDCVTTHVDQHHELPLHLSSPYTQIGPIAPE